MSHPDVTPAPAALWSVSLTLYFTGSRISRLAFILLHQVCNTTRQQLMLTGTQIRTVSFDLNKSRYRQHNVHFRPQRNHHKHAKAQPMSFFFLRGDTAESDESCHGYLDRPLPPMSVRTS